MDVLLKVRHLTKRYGQFTALRRVDMTLYSGEVYGLLGPNGAGKTTLLSILFGLLLPDEGTIELAGREVLPGRPETLVDLDGFVDMPAFYPHLSALDNLRLTGYRRDHPLSDRIILARLEQVGLLDAAHRPVGGFSTGMKKRLGIARALLFPPKLLTLDEPTSGLDPNGVREMRHLIRHLKEEGMTILFSSHILSEVEQIADRIGIIHQGRMVCEDTLTALTMTPNVYWYTVDNPGRAMEVLKKFPHEWSVVGREGQDIQVRLDGSVTPGHVTQQLVQHHIMVHGIRPQRTHLEDIFFQIIGIQDTSEKR